MEKTTNYNLPQWEATDPLRREDFNQAFAALDSSYGDERKPYAGKTTSLTGSTANGTVLAEFEFVPAFVLFWSTQLYCVLKDGSATMTLSFGIYNYSVTVRLSGKYLILASGNANIPVTTTIQMLAFQ